MAQPHGGKFDGAFGVLAGLEAIRTLNDFGLETAAPIEIVAWTNEEGARFAPSMLVSGAGHDACYISLVAPTSMIFVPCAAVINVILFH